jgi:catechol 2,3-dioxygenase-like lactoylglutathione lyase family enzyme
MMRIKLTSVMVDDQAKAQKFYTEVLGFVTKHDIDMGGPRWLTVVAPDEPNGTELLLEPDSHPAAKPFKKALFDSGIPATAFQVDDIQAEYRRLKDLSVAFKSEPVQAGSATVAVFNDTCGNLIQIYQV